MTDNPTTLLGWCETKGRPDQYHDMCPGHITSQVNVRIDCACPNHRTED